MESRYPDYEATSFRDVQFIPALKGSDHCQGNIQEACFITMFLVTHHFTVHLGVLKPRLGCSGLLDSASILSGQCVQTENQGSSSSVTTGITS